MIKANTVEELAYQLWEVSGKPEGQSEHFWFMAENMFNQTINSRISFIPQNNLAGKSYRQISRETGIPRCTIQNRLKRGLTLEEAVSVKSR